MVNFIQSANSKIKINEDVSYLMNDALHVNAVFTATDAIKENVPVLRVNLPNVGKHAKLNWYDTSSNYAATAAAVVNDTVSSVDGIHNITISMSVAIAASQECHIEGWIKLP